jgi:predicted glycoside hydrolase/deacetylase ChbG (UPF0249 family)
VTPTLVIVAAHMGLTEATTSGGFAALRTGLADSGSLEVTGPWAREVLRRYRGEDLGVELVVLSPHPILITRPLTYAPTLVSGEGGFPLTVEDLIEHADAEEFYREARAQLERAILWGIAVSGLSVSGDAAWYRADLADAVMQLAEEFDVVLRLPRAFDEERVGYDAWHLARSRGLHLLDQTSAISGVDNVSTEALLDLIAQSASHAGEGPSELRITYTTPSPEIDALQATRRFPAFSEDPAVAARMLEQLARTIGVERSCYRLLRHRHREL